MSQLSTQENNDDTLDDFENYKRFLARQAILKQLRKKGREKLDPLHNILNGKMLN